ncbi:hypothetical protein ACMSX5_001501 [Cronobacter turicensis]|uniref:hypothetical protein n=1 Tax=Cronobacter turicensis TaxID=413502 RepID=UPI00131A408F|nr:hypothetical protein [Cronobacter turicensis]ELY4607186.1 hypothetical protein [Cronobacter turicensis]EMD9175576.1 hypothetical protein [Cronobacter turicensis]MDI6470969.1 hypothetical protein [Cronobacter turicensis]
MSKNNLVHWSNLVKDIRELYPRIIQPKFIFISFVTLAVSTCGIWIGPFFLKDNSQLGFSIFSFIITTLGVLAAERLSKDDEKDNVMTLSERHRKQVMMSFSIFLWFISFVFSFYGLKNNINFMLILSFAITLLLWLSITVVKPDFTFPVTPDSIVSSELTNVTVDDEPGEGL